MPKLATPLMVDEFDVKGEQMRDYATVKSGYYKLEVVDETQIAPTANEKGSGYRLIFAFCEGSMKGKVVSDYFAHTHKNPEYLARCENKLRRLGKVVGLNMLVETVQLYNKPFYGYLELKDRLDKNGDTVNFNELAPNNIHEQLLSIEEYEAKYGKPAEQVQDAEFEVKQTVEDPQLPRRSTTALPAPDTSDVPF